MIELRTPRGLPVSVPETVDEGPTIRFDGGQTPQIRDYYDEHGYVVVSGVVDPVVCDRLRALWDRDVKPAGQFIYRQTTAKAERHVYNDRGWVMNPILNLQSVDPRRLGAFRDYATDNVLTDRKIADILRGLLDDDPKIVQSMYFEGNSKTWEHQDSYYLDSERSGRMAGAWIAIEPIEAEAGRLFVCPRSHRLDLRRHALRHDIVDNHEAYIQSVVAKMREIGFEIRAPRLEKGDVLFWNAWTIHGSLDSEHTRHSRSSVTMHVIPASDRFLQLQLRLRYFRTEWVNGVALYRPKDLAKARNRVVLWFESRFPRPFYRLKRAAIRYLVARQRPGSSAALAETGSGASDKRPECR